MFSRLWTSLLVGLLGVQSAAAVTRLTVALDGTGDFGSIQAAIDSIPVSNRERVLIQVRDGVYNEKVRIDQSCITLRGESRTGTRIAYHLPRVEYDRRYDRIGPGVVNVFGEDVILHNLTIENTQPDETHAFALYGQPQRLILYECDVLGAGGDTVSLWNTNLGMYYHSNCTFRGGVDFVCPRGWCFVRDSKFEHVGTSAGLWQDGHMDLDMKFVLVNCEFDGPENFWLGRNGYPAQFCLVDCKFSERMADKPIETVSPPHPGVAPEMYERKYFYDCHREGGDYAWHANNLPVDPNDVTAQWAFDGRWDPEAKYAPRVASVEVSDAVVHLYFSEPVAGAARVKVERQDGSLADFITGNGTRHFTFVGGTAGSPPARLVFGSDHIYATAATIQGRVLEAVDLPRSQPRRQLTVVLVGDSTVADYPPERVEMGWGQALPQFLDDRVRVVNWARNGRSSKSFRAEGWWEKALADKGDYVLIQFGHNDNAGKGPERETDPGEQGDFRANLRRYVEEARAAGATPVLVTPTTRRKFQDGVVDPQEGNVPYAEATLAVAAEMNCPVIDLNKLTREFFTRLEESHSHHLQPPGDTTHFTPAGAREVARMVADSLRKQAPALGEFVEPQELVRQ